MTEKQYDLYFSQIIYRDLYFSNQSIRRHSELHGSELESGEILEIKWANNIIEKFEIIVKPQLFGLGSKQYTPYAIIVYNDSKTIICIENLMARRLYEPKRSCNV